MDANKQRVRELLWRAEKYGSVVVDVACMRDIAQALSLHVQGVLVEAPALHPAQKALRKIVARASSPGTLKAHGMQFVHGLRCAANMLSKEINGGRNGRQG